MGVPAIALFVTVMMVSVAMPVIMVTRVGVVAVIVSMPMVVDVIPVLGVRRVMVPTPEDFAPEKPGSDPCY